MPVATSSTTSTARRPGLEKRRVNIDFTDQMVRRLDIEAQRRGVTRQSVIKMWIADRLKGVGAVGRTKSHAHGAWSPDAV